MRVTRFTLVPRQQPGDTGAFREVSLPGRAAHIQAAGFPARISMDAEGQILFAPAELDRRYQLRLELLDRVGRWVAHFEQVLDPQSDGTDAGVGVAFVQPIDGLVIPQSGSYRLHIIVDGTRLALYPVRASHRQAA